MERPLSNRKTSQVARWLPASMFGMVLGLAGMGQAWRVAARLWGTPPEMAEAVLLIAVLVWGGLLIAYIRQAFRHPARVREEFRHPVQGATPSLMGVSTLLIVLAVIPYSTMLAWVVAAAGLAWHMGFSLWHTGTLWQGGREAADTVPTLYLPTVGGNFTSAAALGALGHTDFGWMFLGIGIFSWLAWEPLIIRRLLYPGDLPIGQRPLLGIQFAPSAVCAMAWLVLAPGSTDHWILILLGYGLFQLLLGIRLWRWLGAQPFAPSYWSYTFGIAAATVSTLKLALSGLPAAQLLAPPVFICANGFIGWLFVRTAHAALRAMQHRENY